MEAHELLRLGFTDMSFYFIKCNEAYNLLRLFCVVLVYKYLTPIKPSCMKKIFLICCSSLLMSQLFATVITVVVTSDGFTPANFNCIIGDTIRYDCSLGFHNITSGIVGPRAGLVPLGASDIYSGLPINTNLSNAWTYDYKVLLPGDYRYYCQVHTFDGINGQVGKFTATMTFPAELRNFAARFDNKAVAVTWQTLTEQNVNYFAINRSFNGIDFKEVNRVKASGNSNALQSYRFADNGIGNTSSYIYYSLSTVDQDGKQSLSPIVMVKNPGAAVTLITSLSPNPVTKPGHLTIQFNAPGTSKLHATVYNATGKMVMEHDMNGVLGLNNGHLDVGDLPPGIYNIVFTMGKQRETHRVVMK